MWRNLRKSIQPSTSCSCDSVVSQSGPDGCFGLGDGISPAHHKTHTNFDRRSRSPVLSNQSSGSRVEADWAFDAADTSRRHEGRRPRQGRLPRLVRTPLASRTYHHGRRRVRQHRAPRRASQHRERARDPVCIVRETGARALRPRPHRPRRRRCVQSPPRQARGGMPDRTGTTFLGSNRGPRRDAEVHQSRT